MAVTILAIGCLVFFGHVLTALFQRAKVPDVLVLMVGGILLGPVFHVVEPQDFGKVGAVFTTLALVAILFEGGIHLSLRQLGTAAGDTLLITFATSAVTALLLAHLADVLLPLDFAMALLVGLILSGTSSAVVVPMLRALGLGGRAGTVLFLESALTDVTAIVFTLALVQALVALYQGVGESLTMGQLGWQIAGSFMAAGLVGTGGAVFWSAVLERIRRFPNTVFTTLAYVLILYGVTELAGYSGAIAALAFGVALANVPAVSRTRLGRIFRVRLAPFAEHERAFYAELVFLVKTFFFVFLGVSMSFTDARAVLAGLLLAAAAFAARALVIRLLARPAFPRRDAALMTALVPKGLAAAVLAGVPAQAGLPGAERIQGAVYAAVFFSIAGCAVLVFLVERGMLAGFLVKWFGKFPVGAAAPAASSPEPAAAAVTSLGITAVEEPHPITDFDRPPGAPDRGE